MVKKEVQSRSGDNSFGVAAVVIGILSVVFASGNGVILGAIGLIFSWKQKNRMKNGWSKAGFILNIIGIVIGIAIVIFAVNYAADYLAQIQGGY